MVLDCALNRVRPQRYDVVVRRIPWWQACRRTDVLMLLGELSFHGSG